MSGGFLKRGMGYLGLTDDGYEQDALPPSEDDLEPTNSVQLVPTVDAEPSSNVSLITPRAMRARSTDLSSQVHTVAPVEFAEARQIADSMMIGQPVIVNLQSASRELKRRMIDFCSGVTYALGGTMVRIAANVFLLTPSDVELSADERRRA